MFSEKKRERLRTNLLRDAERRDGAIGHSPSEVPVRVL